LPDYTNKNDLFRNINPEAVLIELNSYPEQIKNQRNIVRNLKTAFDNVDQERQIRELEIMGDITSEVDQPTGKAKFSNDKSRQVELAKRIKTDIQYNDASKKSRGAETSLNQAQDELEMLENKYRSCRYRAEIIASTLRFWAGDEKEENMHRAA
jgi:hypothetical protein